MKKKLNNKTICLAIAAFVLAGSLTVGNAMAYFTAFDTASGEVELDLGFTETVLSESYDENEEAKIVTITNDENGYDCYVRTKALTGNKYKDSLVYSGDDWVDGGDGYYYYSKILAPGESTSSIQVDISKAIEIADNDFNVIIIQEYTPVLYDEDGEPSCNWDVTATITNRQAEAK